MVTPENGMERCPKCGLPVKAVDLKRLGIKCSKYERWEIQHMKYPHDCTMTMHGISKRELIEEWNRRAKGEQLKELRTADS